MVSIDKSLLQTTQHRPWPLDKRPWIMQQIWHDLLFAHWPVKYDELRPLIPSELSIDTYEGEAWLGVVPFRMSDVNPRGMPSLPWLSAFEELNVRTYVSLNGKPGVFFFSLDAANPIAVDVARRVFHLPYYNSHMGLEYLDNQEILYRSHRYHKDAQEAHFNGRYRPTGAVYDAKKGTLEHWLTERYCLYTCKPSGHVYCGEIHHQPWPLQQAEAEIYVNTMAEAVGLTLPDSPPILHFSKKIEVVVWSLQEVNIKNS